MQIKITITRGKPEYIFDDDYHYLDPEEQLKLLEMIIRDMQKHVKMLRENYLANQKDEVIK